MPTIANSRGSKRLAGAASLRYRMPAIGGDFHPDREIAQWVEQQTDTLWVVGSNPAFSTNSNQSAGFRSC